MKRGFSLVELLVAIIILLVILGGVYAFFVNFIDQLELQRKKAEVLKEARLAFRVLEDDIKHAGFALPSEVEKNAADCSSGKGVCRFAVYRCDKYSNPTHDPTFCIDQTSVFFIADGWRIIQDWTNDNCPDGNISEEDYEFLADVMSNGGFFSKVVGYGGSKNIEIDKVDIDNKSVSTITFCGSTGSADERARDYWVNHAFIVCGCTNNAGNYGQEGRRIASISSTPSGYVLGFYSKSEVLGYKWCNPTESKVVPAIVWYVAEDPQTGIVWLWRNGRKVLPNVEFFKVHVGYDFNSNGIVEETEWMNAEDFSPNASISAQNPSLCLRFFWFEIYVSFDWKGKRYTVKYRERVDTLP